LNRRHLLAPDLEAAFALNEEYLGASRDEFFCHYRKNADLFVGIFANSALVGICYGMNWDEKPGCVVLKGIATLQSHWRSGAGSLLIKFFEQQVKKRDKQRITLGSAADLKTENFYLKNGYAPTNLRASVKTIDLPANYERLGYVFSACRPEGETINLYVPTAVRDKRLQAKLKDDLGAQEVIFIMEKDLQ